MKLINIDGPDGVGKSSVTKATLDYFKRHFLNSYYIHFPRYDTKLGSLIKEVLFNRTQMDPKSLQMLYSADRLNFTKIDLPQYEKELDCLLVDRYTTSGLVYTQLDGGNPLDILFQEKEVRQPDLNIILLADTSVTMSRMKNSGKDLDKFENTAKQVLALEYYKDLRSHMRNIVFIDANRSLDVVINDVKFEVRKLIDKG